MNNMVKKTQLLFVTLLVVFLSGCGSTPQPTVQLSSNVLSKEDVKIGYLYVGPGDEATTHIYGAGCLLCYGVASALTSSLDKHLKANVDTSELNNISDLVFESYSKKTQNVSKVSISKPIDKLAKFKGELGFAKRDFRVLKDELGVDILVVLQLNEHGAYRSFSNYVPNGDPQGYISGLLYAVDLETNAYIQYLKLDEKVQPESEWDEPPTFPSVTTSYYQAAENVKTTIKKAL